LDILQTRVRYGRGAGRTVNGYIILLKGEKTFGGTHFYSSKSLASAGGGGGGGGFPILRVVAVYLCIIVRQQNGARHQSPPRVPHNRSADERKSFITAAAASAVCTTDTEGAQLPPPSRPSFPKGFPWNSPKGGGAKKTFFPTHKPRRCWDLSSDDFIRTDIYSYLFLSRYVVARRASKQLRTTPVKLNLSRTLLSFNLVYLSGCPTTLN